MDTRLIQTAVFGSPESDEPALCPQDAYELDIFRREHAGDTIWCGTKLVGGCGRQLTTRRCTDKVCHFAHYHQGASEHRCSARGRGRDSADHLLVKAAFAAWLRTQMITADYAYPEPVGSGVTIRLEDGRVIAVHLARDRPVPRGDQVPWQTVLGPGVRIGSETLVERESVHRIRFDEHGGRRLVRFGIQTASRGTDWLAWEELVLTTDGIAASRRGAESDSVVSSLVPKPAQTRRAIVSVIPSASISTSTTRRGDPGRLIVLRLDRALREEQPAHVRTALRTAQQFLDTDASGDSADAVNAALARARRWQELRARRRTAVIARLKQDFDAGRSTDALFAQAVDLLRDDGASPQEQAVVHEVQAHRRHVADLKRQAREREETRRREQEEREYGEQVAAVHESIRRRREGVSLQVRQASLTTLAAVVRGALKKAARENRVTTWSDVATRTGYSQLHRLTTHDQVDLLLMVEEVRRGTDPLLSAVLTDEGDPAAVRLYRTVAGRLGRSLPDTDADLAAGLLAARAALYRHVS